jgi:Beta-lactamase class C and other penicillin binding proteins
MNNPRLVDAYREARVSDGLDEPEVTTAEAMRRLASVPLGYQPGTGWEYSLATDVLGAVIEKVTGASLEAFVTERLQSPCASRALCSTHLKPFAHASCR